LRILKIWDFTTFTLFQFGYPHVMAVKFISCFRLMQLCTPYQLLIKVFWHYYVFSDMQWLCESGSRMTILTRGVDQWSNGWFYTWPVTTRTLWSYLRPQPCYLDFLDLKHHKLVMMPVYEAIVILYHAASKL